MKKMITRIVVGVAATALTAGAVLLPASTAQAFDTDWPTVQGTQTYGNSK